MKKILSLSLLALLLCVALPAAGQARVFVGVGVGGGYYGGGYYPGYYPGYYYPPAYYAPPPVVYAAPSVYYVPPAAPQVVYQQPVYATVPNAVMANQSSPTYVDDQGRSCREYQTTATIGGSAAPAYGTACMQPDGTWRIVR